MIMGGYKVTYGIGALFIIMSIINVAAQWYVAAMILFASGIITFAIGASQKPRVNTIVTTPKPTITNRPIENRTVISYDTSSRSPIHF